MAPSVTDIPVLISGAGPTGLTAGLLLLKMGVPCRLIERDFHPSPLSKSLGIHSRTLELLQMTDPHLLKRFQDESAPFRNVRIYVNGKMSAEVPLSTTTESHFQLPVLLEQPKTVAILTEEFEKAGGTIERGWELMDTSVLEKEDKPMGDNDDSLRKDGKGQHSYVETVIRRAVNGTNQRAGESQFFGTVEQGAEEKDKVYETQVVRSDFLIAADGGRSAVRHSLKIPFPGRTRDNNMIIFDGPLDTDISTEYATGVHGSNGRTFFLFPVCGNRMRIIFDYGFLTPEEYELQKQTANETLTVDTFQQLLTEAAYPLKMNIQACYWLTYYRINERRATDFAYKQRVFLAGDAAHVHSAAGGQGMNTGIQDAYNLAWKISFVYHGIAPLKFLDSYQEERPALADHAIQLSSKSFDAILAPGYFKRLLIPYALAMASYIMPFLKSRAPPLSMIALRYHENSINKVHATHKPPSGPGTVGERANDGPLIPLSSSSIHPESTENSIRLHELMTYPGAFQVLVFTSDLLLSNQEQHASDLVTQMDHHLDSWRSKWTAWTLDRKKSRSQFMVHVLSAACPTDKQRETSCQGLIAKNPGDGKVYWDVEGALHKKYSVPSTTRGACGAIVIVRPDSYIAYRVLGLDKTAWHDVDSYFASVLRV
ncbi:hypothetical protein EDD11_001133 [Mortierella claussenii]|nr:hypothetical protein EDD11_001133 [Mortierella claussenii]